VELMYSIVNLFAIAKNSFVIACLLLVVSNAYSEKYIYSSDGEFKKRIYRERLVGDFSETIVENPIDSGGDIAADSLAQKVFFVDKSGIHQTDYQGTYLRTIVPVESTQTTIGGIIVHFINSAWITGNPPCASNP